MSKKLPNLETQIRQAEALEKIADKFVGKYPFRVYGVTGLGGENPQLRRTHDAEGVELIITENPDDSDLLNAILSDSLMHEFFAGSEYVDDKGNTFIEYEPKAIKFFRTSNGEVTWFGLADYFEGIETYGFRPLTAFKKWLNQVDYDGLGTISIAKYLNAAWDTNNDDLLSGYVGNNNFDDIEVTSRGGLDFSESYADWELGMDVIKNTDPTYNMLHWSYLSFIKIMATVFFARTNIDKLYGVEFYYGNEGDAAENTTETGTTDDILSHSGFNKNSNQYKFMGLDAAFTNHLINGTYLYDYEFYYSRLVDTDGKYDGDYLKSSLPAFRRYDDDFDLITKMGFDPLEHDFQMPIAFRPTTPDRPEDGTHDLFYSAKAKINPANSDGTRIQMIAFAGSGYEFYENNGLFFVIWGRGFGGAWDDDGGALRLCKPPF